MSEQLDRVLLTLRNAIANGSMAAGTRVVEDELSLRLSVSRTPVRMALRILEAEGLLERTGPRSVRVRSVDAEQARTAILARGVLEGLVVRDLALRGLAAGIADRLHRQLDEGDDLLSGPLITEDHALRYNLLNIAFHSLLLEASGSAVLSDLLAQSDKLPFAGIAYLVYDRENPQAERGRYQFAHWQHRLIVEAILERDTGRAEALAREHANNALHHLHLIGEVGQRPSLLTLVGGEVSQPVVLGVRS